MAKTRGMNTTLSNISCCGSSPTRMNVEDRSGKIFSVSEHSADAIGINFCAMTQFGVTEYTASHDVRQPHGGNQEDCSIYEWDPVDERHDQNQQVANHRNQVILLTIL